MLETKEKYSNSQIEPSEQGGQKSTEHTKASTQNSNEDEVDLTDLIRRVWQRRKTVWITTLVTFLIGIFIAIVSPEEYEAEIILMPQSSSSSDNVASGLLRQFGGLAGLSGGVGPGNGSLTPNLYPDITQSTPFYLYLMKQEIFFSTLDTTTNILYYFNEVQKPTVLDYLKQYIVGLPRLIINLPLTLVNTFKEEKPLAKPNSEATPSQAEIPAEQDSMINLHNHYRPVTLTGAEKAVIGKLKNRIKTSIETNGTVKVTVEMPDPYVAASTTELAVQYLTQYVTEYRIEKARQDLNFIQKQYDEKRSKYIQAQKRLAQMQDRNLNLFTESARTELEQAQTEYQLANSLYQSLAQQLEQAKIKVQEETPVFKVLEPVQVPLTKSKPNRELILFLSLFVGLFLGLGIVFLRIVIQNVKNNLSIT